MVIPQLADERYLRVSFVFFYVFRSQSAGGGTVSLLDLMCSEAEAIAQVLMSNHGDGGHPQNNKHYTLDQVVHVKIRTTVTPAAPQCVCVAKQKGSLNV